MPRAHAVSVRADAVESFLERTTDRFGSLIVDPPRTGMSKEAMAGVLKLMAPRVVYVSCDIATLARDARVLLDAGYRMASLRAFDLFPNTAHVETVIAFRALGLGRRRLFLPVVGGLDQPLEQLAELAGAPEILGMPLHRDAERRVRLFHRFDDAVRRRRGDLEALGDLLHRLVMAAVDVAGLAVFHVIGEQRRQPRALRHPHFVRDA